MWNLVGASVIGTSHTKSRIPCQDHCGHLVFEAHGEQWLALAASDGAGSATHSDIGSKLVVESTLKYLAEIIASDGDLTEESAKRLCEKIRKDIERRALIIGCAPSQLAATLLFAVVSSEFGYFGQVGDGAWVAEIEGSLQPVTWPFRGEYANETYFVTSNGWREGFEFKEIKSSISALAGFTDGIQPVALQYETRSAHRPFFRPLFDALRKAHDGEALKPALEEFLSVDALNERTDDDKTLLLAVRRPLYLLEWTTSTKITIEL